MSFFMILYRVDSPSASDLRFQTLRIRALPLFRLCGSEFLSASATLAIASTLQAHVSNDATTLAKPHATEASEPELSCDPRRFFDLETTRTKERHSLLLVQEGPGSCSCWIRSRNTRAGTRRDDSGAA